MADNRLPADRAAAIFAGRHVAPSILSADFSNLGAQVGDVLDAGAEVIHVDVMDGHFVPPITIGPLVCAAISDQVHAAGAAVDVHLMIEHPADHIKDFAQAGADSITIHVEADHHAHRTLGAIRDLGCRAGLALNPATPVEAVSWAMPVCDLVLCMSVNPGWGGQRLIPESSAKLASLARTLGPGCALEVDGGVDLQTAAEVAEAGAHLLVAGSAVFGSDDPGAAFKALRTAAFGT